MFRQCWNYLRRFARALEGAQAGGDAFVAATLEALIEDPSSFRALDIIGEDNVMVETDYPHFDTTWPDCQQMIRGALASLSPAVVRKVCFANAARIYSSTLPPADLIARSEVGAG